MFHSLLFWMTTVLLVEILIANLLFPTWEGYIGEASKRKHIASETTAKAPSIWPRWRPRLDFSVHVGAKKPQHVTEGNIRFSTFCISDSSWAFALILFKGTYDLPFVNCGGRLSVLLFLDILEHLTQLVYSIIPVFSLHLCTAFSPNFLRVHWFLLPTLHCWLPFCQICAVIQFSLLGPLNALSSLPWHSHPFSWFQTASIFRLNLSSNLHIQVSKCSTLPPEYRIRISNILCLRNNSWFSTRTSLPHLSISVNETIIHPVS